MTITSVGGTFGWQQETIVTRNPTYVNASGTWGFDSSDASIFRLPKITSFGGVFGWYFTKWNAIPPVLPGDEKNYYKRFHYWVEDNLGNIITKDLIATQDQVVQVLSGPAQIQFQVSPFEPSAQMPDGSGPIQFKPWGHIIHAVKENLFGEEEIWASGIMQPSDIDQNSSVMTLKAEGFSKYPKGLPWLENWNPIAVDPADIISRIWNHIESYPNGNLGVTVIGADGSFPAVTGTKMLPGFSFQQEDFVQNFFAIFIRASDRNDCGDYIDKICRDIPLEFRERAVWNPSTNRIDKYIELAYPKIGTIQNGVIFRLGENVRGVTKKTEAEINWLSDVTVKGYLPGVEFDASISNPDPARFRRVMDEQDLHVDSNERAAVWGKKLLTRRQIPFYFDEIVCDPYHYSAPFMSYRVGDFVRVQGTDSWHGPMDLRHKVMMIQYDETKQQVQNKLMAEGAFNYDPIEYVQPGATP